jgi:predicted RNase H-like HicB family nuclease
VNYIGVIHKDPDSDFGVSFPDFPGCITASRTLAEAKAMAIEALGGHIAEMQAAGEPIPLLPTSLDAVLANPDFADGAAFLVVSRELSEQEALLLRVMRMQAEGRPARPGLDFTAAPRCGRSVRRFSAVNSDPRRSVAALIQLAGRYAGSDRGRDSAAISPGRWLR